MKGVTNLIVVNIPQYTYMCIEFTLFALKLYIVICPLYVDKAGKKSVKF